MQPRRLLIINADDFGLSPGVNAGVIRAHAHGAVTSASLMVRRAGASDAAARAREHPRLSVGLHLDFGDWVEHDRHWRQVEAPDCDMTDPDAVAREVRSQLARFTDLIGRPPTHLDSHQHVHRWDPLRSAVERLAAELSIPARELATPAQYLGSFYGQSGPGVPCHECVSWENLTRLIHSISARLTELACHPADSLDFESVYRNERLLELGALCHPTVLKTISSEKIALTSFAHLRAAHGRSLNADADNAIDNSAGWPS